jgi:hypothetical protein
MVKKNTQPDLVSSVPSYFELGGFEWRVIGSDDLTELGKCDCHNQTITIRNGMSEQTTLQTFYHELVHAILFTMGHMTHDEQYTDAFAVFLHQFHKTGKW